MKRKRLRLNGCIFLSLLVALITAMVQGCGGGGEEEFGSDVLDRQPVRIGFLADWSGQQAAMGAIMTEVIVMVSEEVVRMGGILDGRPVDIIAADSQSTDEGAIMGFKSLVLDHQVSVVTGGSGATSTLSGAQIALAEEYAVPYFFFGSRPADLTGCSYAARVNTLSPPVMAQKGADFVINGLRAKRVALLADGSIGQHDVMSRLAPMLEEAGVEVMFEAYPEVGTTDFSPYVDRARDEDVDALVTHLTNPSSYLSMLGQVYETGGWNNIRLLSLSPASMLALDLPGADGTYHLTQWYPQLSDAANRTFVSGFKDRYDGRLPNMAHFYAYVSLWTAIHAIELAGTDDAQAISQAARSGELSWDSPAGPYRIGTDGEHNLLGRIVRVEKGHIVAVGIRE